MSSSTIFLSELSSVENFSSPFSGQLISETADERFAAETKEIDRLLEKEEARLEEEKTALSVSGLLLYLLTHRVVRIGDCRVRKSLN